MTSFTHFCLLYLCNVSEKIIILFFNTHRSFQLDDLELQNIGGSTRIVQEADNVLAIQRRRDDIDRRRFHKFLYVNKLHFPTLQKQL